MFTPEMPTIGELVRYIIHSQIHDSHVLAHPEATVVE